MTELFQYPFFIKALTAAVLTSILCGIIGSYIVSRRIVFISGGITHTSFGGIGLGYFLGIDPVISAAVFGVLSALGIKWVSGKGDVREDSAIGIFWAFGMAVGIIFIYMTPGYAPDLMTYLFGNILMISYGDIIMISCLVIITAVFFTLFYKEIIAVSFDEDFARTRGIRVGLLNYLLISLVALTIVLNIRIVGIILVMSLLTIPQAAASLVTKSFGKLLFFSVLFALISSVSGLFFSYFLNIPSGASIIFCSVILFIVVRALSLLKFLKN